MSSKSAMGCELCLCIECPNHEEAFCLGVSFLENGSKVTLETRESFVLKYGRGPKLEGCAFANFGISSGASRNRTSGV